MSLPFFRKRGWVAKELRELSQRLDRVHRAAVQSALVALQASLAADPRYSDPRRLLPHGAQAFSQNFEDGMIDEIFHRIGTASRQFVEIGVGDGLENNTTLLLAQGWSGWWIEGSARQIEEIKREFRAPIASRQLRLTAATVTAENVEKLLSDMGVPAEFDLLSVDVDRNTYWVWAALESLRPRAAVIEYNSVFPPRVDWKVEYRADLPWNGTAYVGASLKALELLGHKLGYALVGCDLMGVNAFFVRGDLCAGKFAEPFTSENHYEPPRYRLRARMGHPPCFSDLPE